MNLTTVPIILTVGTQNKAFSSGSVNGGVLSRNLNFSYDESIVSNTYVYHHVIWSIKDDLITKECLLHRRKHYVRKKRLHHAVSSGKCDSSSITRLFTTSFSVFSAKAISVKRSFSAILRYFSLRAANFLPSASRIALIL